MANKQRSISCIEADFIAESDMLTAISQILIAATKNDAEIPNQALSIISMYYEGHIENLTTYFDELMNIAGDE